MGNSTQLIHHSKYSRLDEKHDKSKRMAIKELNSTRIRSVERGICPIATHYSSRVAP